MLVDHIQSGFVKGDNLGGERGKRTGGRKRQTQGEQFPQASVEGVQGLQTSLLQTTEDGRRAQEQCRKTPNRARREQSPQLGIALHS
ncbi:MAG: hypothetical protein NVS4B11_37200 [Ktedonobacteraceae bacterium]